MVLLHSSISPSLRLQVLMDNVLTLPETEAVGWQTCFLADNHVRQWQISKKKSPVIWAQSLDMTRFFAVKERVKVHQNKPVFIGSIP